MRCEKAALSYIRRQRQSNATFWFALLCGFKGARLANTPKKPFVCGCSFVCCLIQRRRHPRPSLCRLIIAYVLPHAAAHGSSSISARHRCCDATRAVSPFDIAHLAPSLPARRAAVVQHAIPADMAAIHLLANDSILAPATNLSTHAAHAR